LIWPKKQKNNFRKLHRFSSERRVARRPVYQRQERGSKLKRKLDTTFRFAGRWEKSAQDRVRITAAATSLSRERRGEDKATWIWSRRANMYRCETRTRHEFRKKLIFRRDRTRSTKWDRPLAARQKRIWRADDETNDRCLKHATRKSRRTQGRRGTRWRSGLKQRRRHRWRRMGHGSRQVVIRFHFVTNWFKSHSCKQAWFAQSTKLQNRDTKVSGELLLDVARIYQPAYVLGLASVAVFFSLLLFHCSI